MINTLIFQIMYVLSKMKFKGFSELLLLTIDPLMFMEVELQGDLKKWHLVAFGLKLLHLNQFYLANCQIEIIY